MIIGTAGHIDHGKTALVRALTGVDTDRLKEEKARGITIDLGFAYQGALGFVDVPGHEKLVRNMLAGATGIGEEVWVALLFAVNVSAVLPLTPSNLGVFQAACVAVLTGWLLWLFLCAAARRKEGLTALLARHGLGLSAMFGLPIKLGAALSAMLAIVLMDHLLRHRGQNADVQSTVPVLASRRGVAPKLGFAAMASSLPPKAAATAAPRRVVIKLGTGVLTTGIGQLDTARIASLCAQIARLRAEHFAADRPVRPAGVDQRLDPPLRRARRAPGQGDVGAFNVMGREQG